MTHLALVGVAYAEANWGRWIARCPRPLCTNAMMLTAGQPVFRCDSLGGCGVTADVIWPADPQAIETLLEMRPVPRTRNWLPGESLADLLTENAAHDCLPPELLTPPVGGSSALLLEAVDERVVGGLIHHQLQAAGRREIGA